jgi:hypothetical protein
LAVSRQLLAFSQRLSGFYLLALVFLQTAAVLFSN